MAHIMADWKIREIMKDMEWHKCEACKGQGYELSEYTPTYHELLHCSPRACYECQGLGKIPEFTYADFV